MTENPGKLYIIPTPIGNLDDITVHAIDVLGSSDIIFAEDTRVTSKLLMLLGIKKNVQRLDDNLIKRRSGRLIDEVKSGKVVSYCTDAGMPSVSDPGSFLIDLAYKNGISVDVLPGPSAAITAYVASGASNPNFYFGGFFPRRSQEKTGMLEGLKDLDSALIFFESPKRLLGSLESISEIFPSRMVSVCRELTKVHQEVYRGNPEEVLQHYSESESVGPIRGEIVIVIDGPSRSEKESDAKISASKAGELIERLINDGFSVKDASRMATERFGIMKNEAYSIAIEAKDRLQSKE